MKSIWLSALAVVEQDVQKLMQKLQTYGLPGSGHIWSDDNQGLAWAKPMEELSNPQCAFWAVMGGREALLKPETRYGLSLLALCVQAKRGLAFPIIILQTDTPLLSADELPTPLQRAVILSANDGGTPAKLVAKVHAKVPELESAYTFHLPGNPQFGQWFEIRPTRDAWPGVIFGVDDGEIKFQAVGPAGELPKTSTLNYAMQGLKINFQEREFIAWALQNEVGADISYYVKVEGFPNSLLFGPFSEESEPELYHIKLK